MKNKKAQGLSLNVIIVAVIVLIVLVVLIVIFSGKIGSFSKSTTSTSSEYQASKCKVPGTERTCRTKTGCEDKGCNWEQADSSTKKYDDCKYLGGCCSC